MRITRNKSTNLDFIVSINPDGTWPNEIMTVVLLMDIRDELQRLNRVFACGHFLAVPQTLKAIQQAVTKKKAIQAVTRKKRTPRGRRKAMTR